MKKIDFVLKQFSNGEINTTQSMNDLSEKENINYSDEDYEYELWLIKEQDEEEKKQEYNVIYNDLLEEDSDRIEEYRIEKYESSDNEIYLEDFIEFVESKNTYIKSLKKRYENRIKDSSKNLKQIYMYEVYEYLKNILYSIKRHDDECKKDIIELIEKLIDEGGKCKIYNISSEKVINLIYDLKELKENIECIDFEKSIEYTDLINSSSEQTIIIIKKYFFDKQEIYKKHRSDKFKNGNERKDKYIKLYTSGYKQCEIAKIMGVTESAVSLYLKRNNIK